MIIYNASIATGEYRNGAEQEARQNPMWASETHDEDSRWLYNPLTATTKVPPITGAQEVAVLEGGEWIVKPDYRDKVYYDPITRQRCEPLPIGVNPKGSWTELPPPPNAIWVDGAWVLDLEMWINGEVRALRNNLLSQTDFLYRSDIESKMSSEEIAMRDEYCQALRDFPVTLLKSDINQEISWPEKPVFENVILSAPVEITPDG